MKLEKKISYFIIITVLIPMSILLAISAYLTEKNIEKIEQNYLSVSMNYARNLLVSRKNSVQQAGRVLLSSDQFIKAMDNQDSEEVKELLRRFEEGFSFLDLSMVVDLRTGKYIANKSDAIYDKNSAIGRLVDRAVTYKRIAFSEEVLPISDMFAQGSLSYNRLLVKYQNQGNEPDPYLRKALTGVNVLPIFSNESYETVIGALVICDSLNNDIELTKTFNEHMKDAFLAVSIDGVRILSSITTDTKDNYIGSRIPISSEVTYSDGAQHFGKQFFKETGEYHVFVDEEINNQQGMPVAMMGLGIPEKRFHALLPDNYFYLFFSILVCLIIMMFIGNWFAKRLVQPIIALNYRMTKYGQVVLEHFTTPEASANEIANLNATFMALVKQLGRKEAERKEYLSQLLQSNDEVKKYAEELQQVNASLEKKVNERTADLQEMVKELKSADVAKSTFMANMSHELRTPLNVIMGSADVLQEGIWGDLSPKQQKYVQSIRDSGSHLLQLINDVLDISKMATGKMLLNIEQFTIAEVVQQAVEGIKTLTEKKQLQLTVQISPENFLVNADTNKILEILYNLLSNAAKFTPEHGSIDVSVKQMEDSFKVMVKDSGIGIAEKDQERVFIEFEQVENAYTKQYEGTGLGLPIVKKMVTMMGGQVYLRSMEGIGTEICFIMPVDVQKYLDKQTNED